MAKLILVLTFAVTVLAMVGTGLADEHELPEHPHLLLLGLEFDASGEPIGFRKCQELAAGQALPLNSQHEHVHFGTAGQALFFKAGNAVVPAAPFPEVPWSNCAEFEAVVR